MFFSIFAMRPLFQTLAKKVTSWAFQGGVTMRCIMKKRMNNNNADSASPLTFEQWLSEQPDERLATILRNRPDCALPIPPSFSSLAARLRLPLAVKRAVDKLGAMDIAVVEAASARGAELQPVSTPEVVEEIRGDFMRTLPPTRTYPPNTTSRPHWKRSKTMHCCIAQPLTEVPSSSSQR